MASASSRRIRVLDALVDAAVGRMRGSLSVVGVLLPAARYKLRILEHPTRREILDRLKREPGLATGSMARKLRVAYRTALHHLERLEVSGLVAREGTDRGDRWVLPEDAGRLPEPLAERERQVLAMVCDQEGLHLSEIARRLGFAKATAKQQLDRLIDRGWLRDERIGPLRQFYPTVSGFERLALVAPGLGASAG